MKKWLALVLAANLLTTFGCAVEAADDDFASTSEEPGDDPTQEGDEYVSEDELKLGDARSDGFEEPTYDDAEKSEVLAQYTHVDPDQVVPKILLENALQYYHHNKAKLDNPGWMTIIDMGQHSRKERFYLIGMDSGTVRTTVVAHGSGSDPDNDGMATRFADTMDSHKTSIGYYLTAETYEGSKGYSLKLDGLSTSNRSARARAIVMHSASYVARGNSKQGRSWGCPALSRAENTEMINRLKRGSLLYIDTADGAASR